MRYCILELCCPFHTLYHSWDLLEAEEQGLPKLEAEEQGLDLDQLQDPKLAIWGQFGYYHCSIECQSIHILQSIFCLHPTEWGHRSSRAHQYRPKLI
jgi:hypothetical protein